MDEVLLVDDDRIQLRVRAAILRNAGVESCTAEDVPTALALLASGERRVGAVVTDHNLPGQNGAALVRELRRSRPQMPVLVLSGMPGIDEEYEGLNVRVCLKPFPPEEFIRAVRGALGGE